MSERMFSHTCDQIGLSLSKFRIIDIPLSVVLLYRYNNTTVSVICQYCFRFFSIFFFVYFAVNGKQLLLQKTKLFFARRKAMAKSKVIFALICTLCFLLPAGRSAFADEYSWYCTRTGSEVPPCPREFPYLEEHSGFYVDRNATDDDKRIYLTFDAGYENGNIERVLDVLKENEVNGTFFILENLVVRNPDLVQRMCDEGHIVANHTATHRDMSAVSEDEFTEELTRMENSYNALTGQQLAKFYRPPEGRLSESSIINAENMGYSTVMWSFAYADWDNDAQPDPASAVEKIISNTHNGMIILLHPTSATNAEILGELIDRWQAMGYRFATVDELTK